MAKYITTRGWVGIGFVILGLSGLGLFNWGSNYESSDRVDQQYGTHFTETQVVLSSSYTKSDDQFYGGIWTIAGIWLIVSSVKKAKQRRTL